MNPINKILAIGDLIRVRQWYKNILVLAPLVFANLLFLPGALFQSLIAFLIFCLVSSCMYTINDIIDEEKDARHPYKRERPLPSGKISRREAQFIVAFTASLVLLLSIRMPPGFILVTLSYVVLNLLYSFWFKHLFIIDIFSIGTGFIFRVLAGSIVLGVSLSPWLFIATFLLALTLGFSKRAAELSVLEAPAEKRRVLEFYDCRMLRSFAVLSTTSVVIIYLIYAITVVADHYFILTSVFVLYGCFRFLAFSLEQGLDPDDLMKDRAFLMNIAIWIVSVVFTLYVI